MMTQTPSIHASAVVIGDIAVLIRGPSGSGKSRLAFDLILAGRAGQIPPTKLVGDDRIVLEARENRLIVRPAPELAGLIEIYGLGIRIMEFAPEAPAELIIDLAANDANRLPEPQAMTIDLAGIRLSRIAVGSGFCALPMIVAHFITRDALNPTKGGRLPERNL